jgi:small subunit ribosomal protein S16
VEVVGYYSPVSHPATVKLEHERIAHWLKQGARPSETVARLLQKNPAAAAAPVA